MKKILFFSCLVVLVFSCKKEEDLMLEEECTPEIKVSDYMPMKTGNFWVYEHYRIDSNKSETKTGRIDTMKITGTKEIRGNEYFVFEGTNSPYSNFSGSVIQMLRDSSGYLINQNGDILMTVDNFTDTILEGISGEGNAWSYNYWNKMEAEKTVLVPGIGPIRVIDYSISREFNTSLFPKLKGKILKSKNYYSKGVGKVLDDFYYLVPMAQNRSYIERRLVKYHIEKV